MSQREAGDGRDERFRIELTGFAADHCVFFTAADASMRGFRLIVPPDCIGSQVNRERQSAVRRMVRLLGAQATPSPKVGLEAGIEPAKDEGPMKTPDLP